jgi:hypothetical protein
MNLPVAAPIERNQIVFGIVSKPSSGLDGMLPGWHKFGSALRATKLQNELPNSAQIRYLDRRACQFTPDRHELATPRRGVPGSLEPDRLLRYEASLTEARSS